MNFPRCRCRTFFRLLVWLVIISQIFIQASYADIKVVNQDYWWVLFKGGDEWDTAIFTIDAINPVGKNVTVEVYAGWPWKGATLRGN